MKKGRVFKRLNTKLISVIKNTVFVVLFSVGAVFVSDLDAKAAPKPEPTATYTSYNATIGLYLGYAEYYFTTENVGNGNYRPTYVYTPPEGSFRFCVDTGITSYHESCSNAIAFSEKSAYKLEIYSGVISKMYKKLADVTSKYSSVQDEWFPDGSIYLSDIQINVSYSASLEKMVPLSKYVHKEITVKMSGFGCDKINNYGNSPQIVYSKNCGNNSTSLVLPPYYMGIPEIVVQENYNDEKISGEIKRIHAPLLKFVDNPQNAKKEAGVKITYCWLTEDTDSAFLSDRCNKTTDTIAFTNSTQLVYDSSDYICHEYKYLYVQYGMIFKGNNGVEYFRNSNIGKKKFRFDCVGPELKEIPELNEYGFVTDYVYNEQGKPTAVKLKVDYDDNLSYIPKIMYCFIKIDEINKEGAVCTPDTEVDEVTAKTGSGIIVFVEEDGYYSFTVRAIDAVGNKSADTTFKVNIDLTGPKPVDEQLKSSENYTKQMEGWHYNNGDESEDHKSGTINTNNNLFKFEDVLSIVKINYNPPEIRFSKYIYPEFCISEEVSCYFPLWDYTRRQYKITVVTQKSREIGPVDQIKSMEYCWDNNNDCLSEGDWKTHGIGNEIDYPHKDETGEYEGVYNLRLRAINFAGVYSDIVTLKYNIDHEAPKSTEVDVKTYKEKICKEEICYEISGSTLGGSKNRIEITLKKDEEPSGLKSITYCFSVDGKNCIDNEEFVKSTSGDKVAISVKDRFEKLEKELLNKHNKDNEQNLERLPEANNHIIYLMFKMIDGFVLVDGVVQGEGYGAENVSDFVSKQLYYDNKIGSLSGGSGGNIFISYKGTVLGNNKPEATLMEVIVANSVAKQATEEVREELKVKEVEVKQTKAEIEKEKEIVKVLVNKEEVKEVEVNKEEVKVLNKEVAILDISGVKVARLLNELKCSVMLSGAYLFSKDRKRIKVS